MAVLKCTSVCTVQPSLFETVLTVRNCFSVQRTGFFKRFILRELCGTCKTKVCIAYTFKSSRKVGPTLITKVYNKISAFIAALLYFVRKEMYSINKGSIRDHINDNYGSWK